MIELLVLTASFVFATGTLSMIDAAILSVNPAEVEVLIARKRWGAITLKHLLKHTTRAIIVIVIFTSVTTVLGPILIGLKAEELFGSRSIGIVTVLLTFIMIVFAEIIPKSVGTHYAPRIGRIVAPWLNILIILLFPIVIVMERIARLFKSGKRKVGTEDQIRALANLGGGSGLIDADERELIHRAFSLNDRTARDIMVPSSEIVFIQSGRNIRQAAKMIFEHTYSRYPVIGHSLDEVRGYILSHDALEMLADGNEGHPITDIIREMPTVPADIRCDDLLRKLRENQSQFAIVREQDKTVGLVTLEDVLEELVGEIRDEGHQE